MQNTRFLTNTKTRKKHNNKGYQHQSPTNISNERLVTFFQYIIYSRRYQEIGCSGNGAVEVVGGTNVRFLGHVNGLRCEDETGDGTSAESAMQRRVCAVCWPQRRRSRSQNRANDRWLRTPIWSKNCGFEGSTARTCVCLSSVTQWWYWQSQKEGK